MDLRITSSTIPPMPGSTGAAGRAASGKVAPTDTGKVEGGFSTALKGALQSVSAAQNEATRLQQEVQMENPSVSLEETMVAIQKAQIGFQSVMHVRNRMVQAYTDIMNMQV
ncbi:flagellar hook-basal body complex protein FliE [Ramlibacter sp. H39-3-26]|uniref:flagellar hook-basal body complex protein FliE n=1 Tax=Curvibacter soli TaxID=3031331 RepID=UPI0023DB4973|nr:flagellar hook-basal body complex protein FliE [Ramlibacter sp. H39-3-26]MDF1485774.1 flagellar hook-basal body complex protein FliE [Ramlibacter sp. H39-3-26]